MFNVLAIGLLGPWLPPLWRSVGVLPQWHGVLLDVTSMLQMLVSLWIDRHYDKSIMRYFVWTIWYPFAFWSVNMITTVLALPITRFRRRGKRAVWTSPDRKEDNADITADSNAPVRAE